ncbi:MAG: nucleotidyltransferase family protein [Candidatus Omnitrophica bacterium]|nr:nucleotidyltransferase family protein [Candidatus Omnitrophota bacterium]
MRERDVIRIPIPREQLAQFCRRHHIRRLALFGSVLRSDFRPDSDVDVLVEFEPGHAPGFFGLFEMEEELSALFEGRKVDLRTPQDLSRYFRDEVMAHAAVQYAQGG